MNLGQGIVDAPGSAVRHQPLRLVGAQASDDLFAGDVVPGTPREDGRHRKLSGLGSPKGDRCLLDEAGSEKHLGRRIEGAGLGHFVHPEDGHGLDHRRHPHSSRFDRLCELNVVEQAMNVCQTTVAEDVWARGQELTVHGLVYGLHDGLLRDLGVSASALERR